jgi:hypothetical protein
MTCVKDLRAILARRRRLPRVKPQCQPHQDRSFIIPNHRLKF